MARPQTTQHPAVQTSFSLFVSLFFRCCGSENDMYNRNIQLIKPGLLMTEYSLRIVLLLFLYLLPAAFLFLRWRRETRIRTVAGRLTGEVAYFAPCGKKIRQYPDVIKVTHVFIVMGNVILKPVHNS